uniref:Uncharacterized protein n=1 Tax=Ananas comosus var. bracteatus TaxID=296719 RepID=A0A6V7NYR6_ANACO|nr:unnamed protein product [Ananas comosus var. bracteatus]
MLRIKQNSENSYSFLVAMNCASVQKQKNGTGVLASAKAVSVHALSKNKFLILDSVGDLHVLSLRNKAVPSGITDQCSLTSKEAHTYRLDHPMKIQLLAVLPIPLQMFLLCFFRDASGLGIRWWAYSAYDVII